MNNNFFKEMGGLSQLLFLTLFSFSGLVMGLIISIFLANIMGEFIQNPEEQSLLYLRLSQIITTVFWLLIPASLFITIFHGNSTVYLKLDKKQPVLFIALAIILIIVIQPLVGFIGYLNELIVFPEALKGLESTLKDWRESSERLIERFIADDSLPGILSNVFVIAVLAAFVEEIFFRGCLQQIVQRIVNNKKHIAIWITAIIFSAVHFDFYGFFPRVLLGAMLGYLFVWSGTLWVPIIIHFVNNLLSIIILHIYYGTPEYKSLESFNIREDWAYVAMSIVFTSLIAYTLTRKVRAR